MRKRAEDIAREQVALSSENLEADLTAAPLLKVAWGAMVQRPLSILILEEDQFFRYWRIR